MNDKLSAIWDLVSVIIFACVRGAAICYGVVGIMTNQVEFTTTGILLYLISNSFEKIMDDWVLELIDKYIG